jgi:predicted Holliday junction resolvase-like endonuclease
MEKIKKLFYKIFSPVLIILIIISGYFFYQNKLISTKKLVIRQQNINVYLKLFGQTDFIKQNIDKNTTALSLTKEKAVIKTKGEGVNAYITAINGKVAEDLKKEFWAFYINGKMAEVGAGSYQLKAGDKIEWRLANY